jgi:hypothetical protein
LTIDSQGAKRKKQRQLWTKTRKFHGNVELGSIGFELLFHSKIHQ